MQNKIFFSFDIPRKKASLRVKIWRGLKKLDAKQEMKSFWSLKNSQKNIRNLKNLAEEIVHNEGKIEIMEVRKIWKA